MKLKRIISTALTVVMIFTALVAALPISAAAANSESSVSAGTNVPAGSTEANLNTEQLTAYLKEYISYNFSTAAEMLAHEIKAGYLYYVNSPGNAYTMYINKYTGFVFYVNNITGQILTSNPVNPGYGSVAENERELMMSQIYMEFEETATGTPYKYNTTLWAAYRNQISVTPINGGLRVNYTLGDTTARFLLPGVIKASDFEEHILIPVLKDYQALLEEYCSEEYPDENFSFLDNEDYVPYKYGCINTSSGKELGVRAYLNNTQKIYEKALRSSPANRKLLDACFGDIMSLLTNYSLHAPEKFIDDPKNQNRLEEMYKNFPITEQGIAVYAYGGSILSEAKAPVANIIKKRCPGYTFSMMFAQEKECGYVDNSLQKPVIRCAIEYTFNDDGTLSARLPASSITFDESVYTFKLIAPLQFFGCGDMTQAGYIFYPDGTGTIVEFDDFYNEAANKKPALSLTTDVYGNDYAYANITGAHREQITMPVYGIVNDVKANPLTASISGKSTVTNGYIAVVEEGASLAKLTFQSGGSKHKFAFVYASFVTKPFDTYDLADRISVGNVGIYTMVSNAKYTGSYVTRYSMLTDETLGDAVYGKDAYHKASYVGMATYYRSYLKDIGVLSALETVSEDLPLYIEVLGAMDITTKFLSFPITKTISLTSFDDIAVIYDQLANCEEFVVERIEELKKLLEEEDDESQKYHYQQMITKYTALVGKVQNISNINFKLSGFANGGMKSTYPVKIKWEKACGGKSGFKALVKKANEISATEGVNFGIFPDFDFQYINATSTFDGISNKGNVSKMVDDRYASKQVYNTVKQEHEKLKTLVVNPSALEKLYSKFIKKYSKYDVNGVSLSTLGSDLNSNFDKDEPVNREVAMSSVSQMLDKIVNENDYEIMTDVGNIYAIKYATHILNTAIDSSHLRYASYTVPFSGIILHSYVNYTGSPLNYSGSEDYDILRSIENGAALYYVVCYSNAMHLKDDQELSNYFGVDYNNWYDGILSAYTKLNGAIGDLQKHEIVDHKVLIAERVIDADEVEVNYALLQEEAIQLLDAQLLDAVNAALVLLGEDDANIVKRVKVDVTDENRASLMAQFADSLNRTVADLEASGFGAKLDAIIAKYESVYAGATLPENDYIINFANIEYSTKYTYITDSIATDKNYIYTDYTSDNGNVTMVTYKNGDSVVKFVLNYNNYPVTVKLDANTTISLNAYGYTRIGEVQ